MTITTRLYTLLFGRQVGTDSFGNRYYLRGDKRWVLYQRGAEPSTVPSEWHGWLHHMTDVLPTQSPPMRHTWEKAPKPNLTGTPKAYVPAGHLLSSARHAPTTSEYEAWVP